MVFFRVEGDEEEDSIREREREGDEASFEEERNEGYPLFFGFILKVGLNFFYPIFFGYIFVTEPLFSILQPIFFLSNGPKFSTKVQFFFSLSFF